MIIAEHAALKFLQTFWNIFFLLLPEIGFNISCELSPLETVCMKCQNLFSGKNKGSISKMSSEIFSADDILKYIYIFFF